MKGRGKAKGKAKKGEHEKEQEQEQEMLLPLVFGGEVEEKAVVADADSPIGPMRPIGQIGPMGLGDAGETVDAAGTEDTAENAESMSESKSMSKSGNTGTNKMVEMTGGGEPNVFSMSAGTGRMMNRIIRASAGTGKTYTLVQHYLRLLELGVEPERIAALTFTRKAAGEFFERILQELAGRAERDGAMDNGDDDAGDNDDGSGSGTLALGLLRKVVRRMDRLRLGTIDALFMAMTQSLPFELGLTGQAALMSEEDAEQARDEVLDSLMLALPRMGNEEMLDELREAWKDASHGQEQSSPAAALVKWCTMMHQLYLECSEPERWGGERAIWGGAEEAGGRGDEGTDESKSESRSRSKNLKEAARRLREVLDVEKFGKNGPKRWNEFFGALENPESSGRLDPAVIYMLKEERGRRELLRVAEVEWMMERKKPLLTLAEGAALADALEAALRHSLVMHCRRSRAQWRIMQMYEASYHRLVRGRCRLVFGDLAWLLSGRLGTRPLTADEAQAVRAALEYRMDARHDHWLLDEFQDTSERQWEVLAPLLEEARQDPEEARSVFLVGDLKQSIYLWRQAEPELFHHVERAWAGERLAITPLNDSQRSCPEVLAMVNAAFLGAGPALGAMFKGVEKLWDFQEHSPAPRVAGRVGHAALLEVSRRGQVGGERGEVQAGGGLGVAQSDRSDPSDKSDSSAGVGAVGAGDGSHGVRASDGAGSGVLAGGAGPDAVTDPVRGQECPRSLRGPEAELEPQEAMAAGVAALIRSIEPLARGLSCAVLTRRNEYARTLSDALRTALPGMEVVCESEEAVLVDNPATLALLSLIQLSAHPADSQAWGHLQMTPLGQRLEAKGLSPWRLSGRVRRRVAEAGFLVTLRDWAEVLRGALGGVACGRLGDNETIRQSEGETEDGLPSEVVPGQGDHETTEREEGAAEQDSSSLPASWSDCPIVSDEESPPVVDPFTERRLTQLLDFAATFDESGSRDADEFLRRARGYRLSEDAGSTRAIQVLTVHKSKGLQFDIVILAELQGEALDTVTRNRTFVARGERGLIHWILDKPEKEVVQGDPVLTAELEREQARAAFEGLCRLYVAMTRAKLGLYALVVEGAKAVKKNEADILRQRLATLAEIQTGPAVEATAANVVDEPAEEATTKTKPKGKKAKTKDKAKDKDNDKADVVTSPYELEEFAAASLWECGGRAWFAEIPRESSLPAPEVSRGMEPVLPAGPRLGALLREVNAAVARRTPSSQESFHLTGTDFTSEQREIKRQHGLRVHELLACVRWLEETPDPRPLWAARGWSTTDAAAQQAFGVLENAEVRRWFARGGEAARHRDAWMERPFDFMERGEWVSGTLDRVVVEYAGNERGAKGMAVSATVLDFKTDAAPDAAAMDKLVEGYRPQLALYRRAVARLTGLSVEKVRTVLVFTSVGVMREVGGI